MYFVGLASIITVAALASIRSKPLEGLIHTVIGVGLSYGVTQSLAHIVRLLVGRLRPDSVNRCFGDMLYRELVAAGRVVNVSLIRQVEERGCPHDLERNEIYKSFPSGHAIASFIFETYTALYFSSMLGAYHGSLQVPLQTKRLFVPWIVFPFISVLNSRDIDAQAWKFLVAFSPTIFSLYTAVVRIADHAHHWDDVFVGSLVGIIGALLGYVASFDWCGLPKVSCASLAVSHSSSLARNNTLFMAILNITDEDSSS